jgi:hypothetical protein
MIFESDPNFFDPEKQISGALLERFTGSKDA